jgi:hypothetical protein
VDDPWCPLNLRLFARTEVDEELVLSRLAARLSIRHDAYLPGGKPCDFKHTKEKNNNASAYSGPRVGSQLEGYPLPSFALD